MAIVQLLRLAAARIVGQRLGNSHTFSQYFAIKKAPFHEFLIDLVIPRISAKCSTLTGG